MRLAFLSLVLTVMVLTGCQRHSITVTASEVGPDMDRQGLDVTRTLAVEPVQLETTELREPQMILPLPLEGSKGPLVREIPQKTDGRHLPLVLFPYDSWSLTPRARKILEEAAAWLRTYNHGELSVEGHTDPRGTTSYNYALGLRRANTVIRYLVSLGAKRESMVPKSFGEDAPVCHQISEYCGAMNRRAAVFVAQRKAHPLLSGLTDFTDSSPQRLATSITHD